MVLQGLLTLMLMVGTMFVATSYHSATANLCNALAFIAQRLCTEYVNPTGLTPFTACRLIALDKFVVSGQLLWMKWFGRLLARQSSL